MAGRAGESTRIWVIEWTGSCSSCFLLRARVRVLCRLEARLKLKVPRLPRWTPKQNGIGPSTFTLRTDLDIHWCSHSYIPKGAQNNDTFLQVEQV